MENTTRPINQKVGDSLNASGIAISRDTYLNALLAKHRVTCDKFGEARADAEIKSHVLAFVQDALFVGTVNKSDPWKR